MVFERRCGTMAADAELKAKDPLMEMADDALEMFSKIRGSSSRTGVPLIPIRFHVLYNTAEDNISDAQLQSQILVLNQCFNAANSDRFIQTPAVWHSLIGNPRMQFDLQSITRTHTDKTSFSTYQNDAKFAAQGGYDVEDPTHTLNVWVVPSVDNRSYSGYAQFPYGPASTDGVVLDHHFIGTLGTAVSPFNGGRTLVHEIGHWFNLHHIWGDDGGFCTGSDFVDDTPNQAADNRGIPIFPHVTCSNGPNGDMFMNYMDYTWDATQVMFTQGQCDRMDLALTSGRPALMDRLATTEVQDQEEIGNLGRLPVVPYTIGKLPTVPNRGFAR